MADAQQWLRKNVAIINDELDGEVINWGNGVFTPVDLFINMFGEEITHAIENDQDVKMAISESDNGRGYVDLILN